MRSIKLTQDKFAIVDDEDYDSLSKNSWCVSNNGYAKRGTKSKGKTTIHYMHRQILDYPNGCIDHINGNKLDNTRSNLRITNQSVNQHNRHIINKNNTSNYKGVWFDKKRNKFVAEVWIKYKKTSKRFDDIEDAIKQRKEWELAL